MQDLDGQLYIEFAVNYLIIFLDLNIPMARLRLKENKFQIVPMKGIAYSM